MLAVRVLLQVVIVVTFLLALDVALSKPMTADHISNIIGVSLFGIALFSATFFIGDPKEKRTANVLGDRVNPKLFGFMSIVVGTIMLFAAWHVLSGRPVGESPGMAGRGAGIIELLFQIPALLVPAGLAMVWYGVKLFRSRQPKSRMHRTRKGTARR
jgi:hypothetical protein